MKKIISIWLACFCSTTTAVAQYNLPPVYEITTDTALFNPLPNGYWQMLEDQSNNLSFKEVTKSPFVNKFHFDTTKDNKFNFSIHAYWFRYYLKNRMDHDAEIGFITNSEQSQFYLFKNGKWIQFENGALASWKKLNGLQLNNYIPVILNPGEELIVYNRVNNTFNFIISPSNFLIGFNSTKKITAENYIQDESLYISGVHDSILFGILLFAGLFNFFFFLVVRERVYLYFSLYVILLGLGRMTEEFYYVFLREFRVFWAYLSPLVWTFTFFILTFFIRSLLQTSFYLPRWDKFLKGLNYFFILLSLTIIFIPSSSLIRSLYPIELPVRILLTICNLLSFFLILNKRENARKILMIAILPAFCIWAIGNSLELIYLSTNWIVFSVALTNWLHAWWYYIETLCLTWMVLFYSWLLLQRFRELQKQITQQALEKEKEKRQLIEQQKIELERTVEERTAELQQSLNSLKSTQAQLIQSEKMASLGELTAGIAHEIQNPLNFVNNFSEVNGELIKELKREVSIGNMQEVTAIADDIEANSEKINHHGKRADAIVKGMLQHSRTGSGIKEPSDINRLADEYLRLAYQGFRARDKSFNATFSTEFDNAIDKVNIVPQEIGRVILNLINNAFYAVNERSKQNIPGYEPAIIVGTRRLQDRIEINVKDNGNGVPAAIKEKIFQPFFTTKPTGQGTGLGLSLAYDIVKAHGGKIKVETKEEEGSAFTVELPI